MVDILFLNVSKWQKKNWVKLTNKEPNYRGIRKEEL
jgi:hypothetical protein